LARVWIEECDAFRAWERQKIELTEPDAGVLAQYRDDLKHMLRLARTLDAQINDPDFPAGRVLAAEVKGRLIQLQYSWDALDNPMTTEEANKLEAKYFHDESRS